MNFAWFVTKQIDYLVDFYSKSNRLSISIFTVFVIDIALICVQLKRVRVFRTNLKVRFISKKI